MSGPDPRFAAIHPSAQVLFRSCADGSLHSVILGESAMVAGAAALADAILRAADVSHLKAVLHVRRQILASGCTPSGEMPTPGDLHIAETELGRHRLTMGP